MKVRLLLIVFLIFFSSITNSAIYHCPKQPIDIEIGKTYNGHWFAWKEVEHKNWLNQKYYQLFSEKYHLLYWTGFPQGFYEPDIGYFSARGLPKKVKRNAQYFIGCCVTQRQESKSICLYRFIKETDCKAMINESAEEHYICHATSKNIT